MSKKYSGENGISIKLIMQKLETEIRNGMNSTKRKVNKKTYKSGKLNSNDMRNIMKGLEVIQKMTFEFLNSQERQLLSGENDVSKIRKELCGYRYIVEDIIRSLKNTSRNEYFIKKETELLDDYSKIMQAARDGIIIKQDKRQELINGKLQEFFYDTSMSPEEVISVLREYNRRSDQIEFEKLQNYLGLGLGVAGIIGVMVKENKDDDENNSKSTEKIITLGTVIVGALKLMQGVLKKDDRQQQHELRDKQNRMISDLLANEQISNKTSQDSIRSIIDIYGEERKVNTRIENKRLLLDLTLDLVSAIISGAYINSKVQINENGKIDGKLLASALLSLYGTRKSSGNLVRAFQGIQKNMLENEDFEELSAKVRDILKQMDEKVYPLEGAKKSFNSVKIENFSGLFYPKKNYQTGETEYMTKIEIDEFYMKRGDIVLLSGESGSGKSTFLRLLKRGDIKNRNCITLDDGQVVDNLGEEYISFRPSIDLGNENNVLSQITGKQSISDLNENESDNLVRILNELNLNSPDLLEQLASKKFMEFSTGQQRRLALSKLFYRINDGTSVIIVDEPVGNVEDRLIREQLQLIVQYAKNKNVMLLLTTHRIDLVEDLVNKRYHIDNCGILKEMEIEIKDKSIDEENSI